jgi:hypothetical protein
MRASKLVLISILVATPAVLSNCSSSGGGKNAGTGGSDEETGGSGGGTATGGKPGTGGKGGSGTGGSAGDTGGSTGTGGSNETGGAGGTAGSNGGSGGADTGGSGGGGSGGSAGTGGTGGSAGQGGSGGSSAVACGMGRAVPTGPVLDNFDGMKQVQAWEQAYAGHPSMVLMPTGALKVTVLGTETYADGLLAPWASTNRACMDASKYTGIQFTATGNVTSLFFRIGTAGTYPVSEGGTCANLTTCGYAHYQKNVTTGLTGGAPTKVAFADLVPPFGTPPPFDKSSLITIIFLTQDTNTAHSFTIDNILFY